MILVFMECLWPASTITHVDSTLLWGASWKLLAIVKCEYHTTASVSIRHIHSLTVIIEQEQVLIHIRISAWIKLFHTWGPQWCVGLPFWTDVLHSRPHYTFRSFPWVPTCSTKVIYNLQLCTPQHLTSFFVCLFNSWWSGTFRKAYCMQFILIDIGEEKSC